MTRERKNLVFLMAALVATLGMLLWMANREPFAFGPLWGAAIAVMASAAWVTWLVPESRGALIPWRETLLGRQPGELVSPMASIALAMTILTVGATLGGYDRLPIAIILALLCLVPSSIRRPGLFVMVAICAIYLPLLGTTSLLDPWETHYGEVAREILARNDWISLWWAQDKWFWSKPVLLFWLEAMSMGFLGVDFMPDANPAHPEWALRLPVLLMSLAALAAIYAAVRRSFGPRAGVLAALVTATMPQFFFISHQAITDLPLVAAITIAACCLIVAVEEDPEREASVFQLGPWRLSLQHLLLFAVFVLVLPQAVYLISRNISWLEGSGLVAHMDRFLYGSAGNADVPGNPAPRDQTPAFGGLGSQPFLQGFLWLSLLAALALVLRKERRVRPLLIYAFYLFTGIAFMAKGLLGIAIPGAMALLYLIASRRWALLGRGELRVATGALIVTTVSMPWYLAMYVRHGSAFTNRLLIHDHINRLATGVHGDKGTIAYFVGQLGYATFPWIALIPAALLVGLWMRSRSERDARNETLLFVGMWLLSSFVLFSAMVTKFHHYILPTIVPAGILVGIAAAQCWGPSKPRATLLASVAALCAILGFAWFAGDPRGVVPVNAVQPEDWVLQQGRPVRAGALLAACVALAALARSEIARAETKLTPGRWGTALGVALVLGACVVAFVGRDLSWATSARPQGNERLIHLFVYNYGRVWPEHLDYRAILTGFAMAAGVTSAAASLRSWRPVATRALVAVSVLFCVWGLNVYMVDISDHWGIRGLAKRYYDLRQGPEEPLLAWQMNWKGENFYTGNRVYVFAETDNKRIREWLDENEGRTAYVVLEHKRLERFRKLVPKREVRELSTKRDSNKFLLIELEI
ncbi:MAG: glycosyltransferase family 39 protein [Deltaproteobacteria bacterium]|nr:glycosyltransferase family 39 protein [Deltaproteobacteria bacterium]